MDSSVSYSESSGEEDSDECPSSPQQYSDTGYLVHIYKGKRNPVEHEAFRKICMKFGLQAWDEMEAYMPWHERSDFRTTLCKTLKRQALSEYRNMRADPVRIGEDNEALIHSKGGDVTVKQGMIVNQKWNRGQSEITKTRNTNAEKYAMSRRESDKVEVPILMPIEYIQKQVASRYVSAVLYRAYLINELNRRMGITGDQDLLKGAQLKLMKGSHLVINRCQTRLAHSTDTTRHINDNIDALAQVACETSHNSKAADPDEGSLPEDYEEDDYSW